MRTAIAKLWTVATSGKLAPAFDQRRFDQMVASHGSSARLLRIPFALLLVALGALAGSISLFAMLFIVVLDNFGVETDGTVIEHVRGSTPRHPQAFRYEFKVRDGRTISGRQQPTRALLVALQPGDRLRIRYLPLLPVVNGPSLSAHGPLATRLLGFVMLVPLLVMLWLGVTAFLLAWRYIRWTIRGAPG